MKLTTVAAVVGAVFGGLLVLSPHREIWSDDGGYAIIKWSMTAIAFLSVLFGAIYGAAFGAALAALWNWMKKGPSR